MESQETARADSAFHTQLVELLPQLRAYARVITRDPDRADDLVQQTVERALKSKDQFRDGTNLKGWLFTILRNSHISNMRRANLVIFTSLPDHMPGLAERPTQMGRMELRDFARAFDKLSEEHREVLILCGAEGMRYEEVAEICGCPMGTVKSRLSRARAEMRRLIEGEIYPRAASPGDRQDCLTCQVA